MILGLLITWMTSLAEGEELDSVRLQLKWRHQFQFAGYYAAIDQGYYREEGLEVELIEPEVGQDPFDLVLAGNAEFGVSNSEIVWRSAEGEPVVQLAVIYQHSPLVLLSIRDYGIETLHDLAGHSVMIEPNAADLLAMFRSEGIDLGEIQFLPHEFSVEPLVDGEVQAISGYVSDEPYAVEQLGLDPIIFTPRSAGIDFYGDGIFTTREQVEKHPDRVEAFRRASLRGWEYALMNPDEIIDLILNEYSQRKTRDQLEYEAMKTMQLVRADLVPVGYMNPGRWRYISEVFYENGLIEEPISPEQFLYAHDARFPWKTFFVSTMGLAAIAIVLTLLAWYLYRNKLRLEAAIRSKTEVEKKLRHSEEFYRNFYESAPLAFVIWDENFKVLRWNAAAERVFGWKASEVVGRSFDEFMVPEEDFGNLEKVVSHVRQKEVACMANWNLRKDGTKIWCQWHNVALFGGDRELVEVQSIALDATLQYEREQRLVTEREVAEMASKNKGQFLASVSHEIRNPLSAIISFANFIREDCETEERRDMADTIISSGEALIRILNDLIDHEKLGAGVVELVPSRICLGEVVQKTMNLHQRMAKEKDLELHFEISHPKVEVTLDTLRVQQVLNNLLSNAIKFTEKGSILISVDFDQTRELPVQIRCEDTGIGISQSELKSIFRMYDQGEHGKSKVFRGTGVGLAVCEKLVMLMGGRIEVQSEEGAGSTFTVHLPEKMAVHSTGREDCGAQSS